MDLFDLVVAKKLAGGGGGGGGGVLIGEKSLGTIAPTSTSATSITTVKLDLRDQDAGIDRFGNYDFIFAVAAPASAPTTNGHINTWTIICAYGDSNAEDRNSGYAVTGNYKMYNGTPISRINNSKYGVYVNTVSTTTTGISLDIYVKQSDSYTGTINGDYTMRFYGLTWDDIM